MKEREVNGERKTKGGGEVQNIVCGSDLVIQDVSGGENPSFILEVGLPNCLRTTLSSLSLLVDDSGSFV